jgi:predicted  nucleic acid-binding Zn-ribbon protein
MQMTDLEGEILDLKDQMADLEAVKADLEGHVQDLSKEMAAAEREKEDKAKALKVSGSISAIHATSLIL